jgi:enoyl-CoA hydratase/carnithine racemase
LESRPYKSLSPLVGITLAASLDADGSADWMVRLKRLYEALRGLDKPCVAALNGASAAR